MLDILPRNTVKVLGIGTVLYLEVPSNVLRTRGNQELLVC